jgi:prepilin-type N-terminal cleavage/methylation domain-containing protein
VERANDRRDALEGAGKDAGFTFVELMVVLLVVAILLAIAIPTYLSLTGGAKNQVAQADLNTSLTNAKADATQNGQTYAGLKITGSDSLQSREPSITWVIGPVDNAGPVSVYIDPANGNGIILASWTSAKSGTCWYAVDNMTTVPVTAGSPYNVASSDGGVTNAPTNAGTFYGADNNGGTGISPGHCNAGKSPVKANWGTQWPPSP